MQGDCLECNDRVTRPPMAAARLRSRLRIPGRATLLLVRWRGFAWAAFSLVVRWTLVAYVVSAGRIEFSFVRNHAT
jgi:hypothetical protein